MSLLALYSTEFEFDNITEHFSDSFLILLGISNPCFAFKIDVDCKWKLASSSSLTFSDYNDARPSWSKMVERLGLLKFYVSKQSLITGFEWSGSIMTLLCRLFCPLLPPSFYSFSFCNFSISCEFKFSLKRRPKFFLNCWCLTWPVELFEFANWFPSVLFFLYMNRVEVFRKGNALFEVKLVFMRFFLILCSLSSSGVSHTVLFLPLFTLILLYMSRLHTFSCFSWTSIEFRAQP